MMFYVGFDILDPNAIASAIKLVDIVEWAKRSPGTRRFLTIDPVSTTPVFGVTRSGSVDEFGTLASNRWRRHT